MNSFEIQCITERPQIDKAGLRFNRFIHKLIKEMIFMCKLA